MSIKEKARLIKKISGSAQSIAVGAVAITAFTLLSKAFGFVREMILAANFGTSWRLDAVIIAMEPAESLSGIIAGAFGVMMIPVYLELKNGNNPANTARYASQMLKISGIFLFLFSFALLVFPDYLIKLFAPSFSGEILDYAARKLRIMSILPIVHGISTISISVLKSERRFIQMASFQLIFNAVSIPLLIFLAPLLAEAAYVFAWVAGFSVMVIFSFWYSLKFFDKKEFLSFTPLLSQTKKTILLSLPLVLSHSISTLNAIIDKVFASFLPAGRISALRYSHYLLSMITSLIVASLLTVTYTEIGEFAAKKDFNKIEIRAKKTNNDLMNIVIPLTFWIILMADQLIGLIFERGAFDSGSTELVSASLIAYSVIILISPVSGLIVNIFISLQHTKFLNIISALSIGLNAFFDWIFMKPFGHAGIAASTSGVGVIITVILFFYLKKKYKIVFIDFKRVTYLFLITISIFISLLFSKIFLPESVWLLAGNSLFLVVFISLNRKLILSLAVKIGIKNLFSKKS